MPGISLRRLRSPFRRNRRQFTANGTLGSTLPTLPRQGEDGEQEQASESPSDHAVDSINVDQLRSALCAFLGIEGRENSDILNQYIQTFTAASAAMGDANTLGYILGQSDDEFHNTLEVCRFISELFEMEVSAQQEEEQQLLAAIAESTEQSRSNSPPAHDIAINSLPFERILPADRLNFQHDKTCCPICFELLIDGLILTRLPCGHLYHQDCAVTWLSRSGSCPECRFELPTAMGDKYEDDRCARMKQLKYQIVRCTCVHQGMGVHTCFFRDQTKLLSEQVTNE